jgi:hypothetical protein
MPAGSATCAKFAEITGVAVDGKDHVAGIVCENCIVLGGDVVKELFRVLECVEGGFGGLGGNGTDGAEECGVDCVAKKEEFTADLLDKFLAFLVE